MSSPYEMYVGGEWVTADTASTIDIVNPANADEVVARYQDASASDAERAIEAAAAARDRWATVSGPERGRILKRTGEILDSRTDEAVGNLVREEGKTRSEATGEVQRAVDIFSYYAQKARDLGGVRKSSSGQSTSLSTRREPLGTVALITPWNYPIAIPAWKLAPALAAGNTVVVKPASQAPGPTRILFECLAEAGLPDGVANMVTGAGSEVGTPLVEHSAIAGVSFTGSTSVGTDIARTAARERKRIQAEMGGKNPTVVMPSADLDRAVEIVGSGAFGTTGQSCTATSRAIVHEDLYDEFVEQIAQHAESLTVGPGLDDPDMGPHVSANELESTLQYVNIGTEEGATLVTGGSRLAEGDLADGFFVAPTVFADVNSGMRIAQEEIFGPVLSVIKASSFDDAVTLANDVEYGLSASIVTDSHSEAERFLDRVESGVAKVNEKTTGLELHAPFGGYKNSSTNTYREQGDAGLDFFTSTKTVYRSY
ncbi:aldehyde dehydrogenase family protein [Haloarcula laminariae]|uniref:2,5-dioxovalerate dehydrogenase n=1 Tax=Haloarcula laminariae TaxID=2961577 RepID=UPI0021C96B6B|nr:aldehyde dehydrogenase family protein [Halomicroarcula laminariae]